MRTLFSRLLGLAACGLAPLALFSPAYADWELNLTRGVTEISRDTYDLHMTIFWICVGIAVVVFGVMFYSVFRFRRSKGAVADTSLTHSTRMEIIWTIIPVGILIAMAIPAAETLVKIEDTRSPDVTIKVTGYQWRWRYQYLDENVDFFSSLDADSNLARQVGSGVDPFGVENYLREVDNPVVVPVNKKVRMLLTSNDVLHAWWVPDLGGKRDAIPGFINELWFRAEEPGIYRGQCAELCGRDHGFMPIVVHVRSEEDYQTWLAEQRGPGGGPEAVQASAGAAPAASAPAGAAAQGAGSGEPVDLDLSRDQLMARGEQVYLSQCSACHQPNGMGLAAAGFPAIAGSAVATGDIAAHLDLVLKGRPGTAMASFAYLDDADLAAIITYQRNAWGNDTGDLLQPADVAAAR